MSWTSRPGLSASLKNQRDNVRVQHCYKLQNVVEWIPFNKIEHVQKIGKRGFDLEFSATWLDGKRIVSGESHYSAQSRILLFIVHLSITWFKSYMQSRLLGSDLEVYRLTQITTNNEYLIVFNMQIKEAFIIYNKESVKMSI
ncbi:hypothetical protein C2G38_2155135 [Gigaspora rosea]|uniref:Uncharacterized protein n=1 Tax=Gigaspora rosea TaxID=44941 RepID=A0A397W454_9GLOM|nr:hypothetical protein C2G38_2155135 [Gigaspora rosea]